ncbi:MAG: hypothetical protein QW728_03810 [Thermoplasmata archaeon]
MRPEPEWAAQMFRISERQLRHLLNISAEKREHGGIIIGRDVVPETRCAALESAGADSVSTIKNIDVEDMDKAQSPPDTVGEVKTPVDEADEVKYDTGGVVVEAYAFVFPSLTSSSRVFCEFEGSWIVLVRNAIVQTGLAERYPGLRIIGWVHTHPGHGVFLSGQDRETMKIISAFDSRLLAVVCDASSEMKIGVWRCSKGIRPMEVNIECSASKSGEKKECRDYERLNEDGELELEQVGVISEEDIVEDNIDKKNNESAEDEGDSNIRVRSTEGNAVILEPVPWALVIDEENPKDNIEEQDGKDENPLSEHEDIVRRLKDYFNNIKRKTMYIF